MTPKTLLPLIRIIDDDEALLASSALLLRSMGWEVETWSDGASFLEAESLLRPGCIILDVQMPGMDGYEATRRIRALPDPRKAGIPIFAMTANAFYDDVRQSREAGMVEHLSKPKQEQELLDAIRRHVKR